MDSISIGQEFAILNKYKQILTRAIEEKLNIELGTNILTNIIDLERKAHQNGIDTKVIWANFLKKELDLTPDEYVEARIRSSKKIFHVSSETEAS